MPKNDAYCAPRSFPETETRDPQGGITMKKLVHLLAGLVVAVGLGSAPALAQTCENPAALRFSLVPTQDSIRELSYYKPILDLLGKNTGKKIEFYMPTSYASVIEALLGKWVDVAVLGPEAYVIAKRKEPTVEVFGTYYRAGNGIQTEGPGYKSVLITKKGSKFTTIESLKGSVLALVDPASTSGSLIPENVFPKEAKIPDLKTYFSRVVFSGGHDLSSIAVAEGKADAAFVASHRFMETVNAGKVKQEDFNYLWYSPLIPQDPFVYRSTLCPDLKAKIVETFTTVDQTPEGKKYLENVKSVKFVPMKDSDYDIVRAVTK
jgi:phosphonate transport system substrate-binding protein